MIPSDNLTSRADALMRKRRSFVAKATPRNTPAEVIAFAPPAEAAPAAPAHAPTLEVAPPIPAPEDDLPVLTEVVDPALVSPEVPEPPDPEAIRANLEVLLSGELAQALEARLLEEIPALVASLQAELGGLLEQRLTAVAAATVQDFLTRHQPDPADPAALPDPS